MVLLPDPQSIITAKFTVMKGPVSPSDCKFNKYKLLETQATPARQ
jgi:hypothetical protein